MAKIYAKNEKYTGVSASVGFVNGVGETSDPHLMEWFREHGYRVVEEEETAKEEKTESAVKGEEETTEEASEETSEEKKNGRKK